MTQISCEKTAKKTNHFLTQWGKKQIIFLPSVCLFLSYVSDPQQKKKNKRKREKIYIQYFPTKIGNRIRVDPQFRRSFLTKRRGKK